MPALQIKFPVIKLSTETGGLSVCILMCDCRALFFFYLVSLGLVVKWEALKLCSVVVSVMFHFILSVSVLSHIIIFALPHWVRSVTCVIWYCYYICYCLLLFCVYVLQSLPVWNKSMLTCVLDNELATCSVPSIKYL